MRKIPFLLLYTLLLVGVLLVPLLPESVVHARHIDEDNIIEVQVMAHLTGYDNTLCNPEKVQPEWVQDLIEQGLLNPLVNCDDSWEYAAGLNLSSGCDGEPCHGKIAACPIILRYGYTAQVILPDGTSLECKDSGGLVTVHAPVEGMPYITVDQLVLFSEQGWPKYWGDYEVTVRMSKLQYEWLLSTPPRTNPSPFNGEFPSPGWPSLAYPTATYEVIAEYRRVSMPYAVISSGTGQVHAAADGVVEYAGWDPACADSPDPYDCFFLASFEEETVIVNHGHGWRTVYLYLTETGVISGQSVSSGDLIGSTDRTYVGFALQYFSDLVDPLAYASVPVSAFNSEHIENIPQ